MGSEPAIPIPQPELHELPQVALDRVAPIHLRLLALGHVHLIRQVTIGLRPQVGDRIHVMCEWVVPDVEEIPRVRSGGREPVPAHKERAGRVSEPGDLLHVLGLQGVDRPDDEQLGPVDRP
jgi:hypothetical protein